MFSRNAFSICSSADSCPMKLVRDTWGHVILLFWNIVMEVVGGALAEQTVQVELLEGWLCLWRTAREREAAEVCAVSLAWLQKFCAFAFRIICAHQQLFTWEWMGKVSVTDDCVGVKSGLDLTFKQCSSLFCCLCCCVSTPSLAACWSLQLLCMAKALSSGFYWPKEWGAWAKTE